MALNKLSNECLNFANKRVLMRVDFNVPLKDGKINNNQRIVAALESVRYALDKNAECCAYEPFRKAGRKKEVPQQNYLMHVAHCARNVCICPACNEPVAKAQLEEHKNKVHKQIQCPACKEKLESCQLSAHKKDKCPKRMASCQHCELELPFADLQDHIYHCGARTDRCEECGELVMLKYQKLHKESNHGFVKLDDEPGPTPSWVQNEQTACQREIEREERRSSNEAIRPRDLPRTFVPAYDASEDLRAKVKLARHDLNNIKHSVLAGEERVRELTRHARTPINANLTATGRRPPPLFQTNLVPYEKNKSSAINALPLDVASPNNGPKQGCFTYLGTPAPQNGVTSITSGPKKPLPPLGTPPNSKGAVPRKKKGPAPPIPTQRAPASPGDEIPCEFCNKMVPRDRLVLHETGCRPDLAQKKPPEGAAGSNHLEVELPCEFCCLLIPASRLLSHQALCDV